MIMVFCNNKSKSSPNCKKQSFTDISNLRYAKRIIHFCRDVGLPRPDLELHRNRGRCNARLGHGKPMSLQNFLGLIGLRNIS
jgi:hypothetical protein